MASNKKTEYSIYLFISKCLSRSTRQEFGRGVKCGAFMSVNLHGVFNLHLIDKLSAV